MDDHKVFMLIFLITTCTAGISTVEILYQDVCVSDTSNAVTYVKTQTNLTNNYPGTCFKFCENHKVNIQYLALKGQACMCGEDYTLVNNETQLCNTPMTKCPGHFDHLCGAHAGFSVFKNEINLQVKNRTSCLAIDCGGSKRLKEFKCTEKRGAQCAGVAGLSGRCENTLTQWNVFSTSCYNTKYARYYNSSKRFCKTTDNCSLKNYWVGVFALWAPPKSCQHLSDPENGTLVNINKDTVEYRCNHGYKLDMNVTRYCMANGFWTGREPNCTKAPDPPTIQPSITKVNATTEDSTGLSIGEIVGICFGILLLVVGVVIVVYVCYKCCGGVSQNNSERLVENRDREPTPVSEVAEETGGGHLTYDTEPPNETQYREPGEVPEQVEENRGYVDHFLEHSEESPGVVPEQVEENRGYVDHFLEHSEETRGENLEQGFELLVENQVSFVLNENTDQGHCLPEVNV